MHKIRVMIVDDHALMRDGIRALLTVQDDMEVVGEASEGKEAVEKAAELSPEVVIMDLVMPGMDGIEATRRIARKNPAVKILVLTQHDNRDYILWAIKAGATGYVPKKALGSDLVSAIRAVRNGESFLYPSAAAALIEDYRHRSEVDPFERLTDREKQILRLIAEGKTSPEIARLLSLNVRTVIGQRNRITEKLDLHNRAELIKFALRKGLVSME